MTSPSELEQSFQGPGFTVTFLYYSGLATLIVAIAAMEVLHVGFQSVAPYQYALIFALPFGLFNAFTKRSKTMRVPIKSRKKFDKKLIQVLSEMDYEPLEDEEIEAGVTYQTFQKSSARWFSGKVYVAIAAKDAIIAGRSSLIKKLESQF